MSQSSPHSRTDLQALPATCWQELAAATEDPAHPWRTPAVATLSGQGAAVRTVVLRETRADHRVLSLHTDARSAKAGELAQAPRLSWLFWNAATREQLRCRGKVTLHQDDEVARAHWEPLTSASRSNYLNVDAPGTTISDPQVATARRDDEATAFSRFLVVCCVVDHMDWLRLDRAGHLRARLDWTGDDWNAAWIAP